MKKITAITLISMLSACSSIFPNKTTETRDWQTADCNGASGWEVCYKKAGARCPGGYDTANREEDMLSGSRKFAFACQK